jgi:hypothetical protein
MNSGWGSQTGCMRGSPAGAKTGKLQPFVTMFDLTGIDGYN